jgi:predicted secreted protein
MFFNRRAPMPMSRRRLGVVALALAAGLRWLPVPAQASAGGPFSAVLAKAAAALGKLHQARALAARGDVAGAILELEALLAVPQDSIDADQARRLMTTLEERRKAKRG